MKINYSLGMGQTSAKVYFSPHTTQDDDPMYALLNLINHAKKSINFAIYSFTLLPVAAALIAAAKRGVAVRGVGDAGEWDNVNEQFAALKAAGLDVRKCGSQFRLMHLKSVVVDDKVTALGSWNWTTQAEQSNFEVMVVLSGKKLAAAMNAEILAAYTKGV